MALTRIWSIVKISEKYLRLIGKNGFEDKGKVLLTLNALNAFENIVLINQIILLLCISLISLIDKFQLTLRVLGQCTYENLNCHVSKPLFNGGVFLTGLLLKSYYISYWLCDRNLVLCFNHILGIFFRQENGQKIPVSLHLLLTVSWES